MRLAKYLAHAGVASRRAAEELIRAGRVHIDGAAVLDPARDVDDATAITVDGDPLAGAEPRATHVLNKPAGVLSAARDDRGRTVVTDLVPSTRRLYPVGRLDADASGLILLTNDGELAHRLTHPRYEVPRTYRLTVARPPVRDRTLRALREGIELEDGATAPARARRLAPDRLELVLHEGRNRQVRRMCDAVGHPVTRLVRVAFGPLALGRLGEGRHRRLTAAEEDALRRTAGLA